MKDKFENLQYCLSELNKVIRDYRFDFPEDIYKVLIDLLFHASNELTEMYNLYVQQQEESFK